MPFYQFLSARIACKIVFASYFFVYVSTLNAQNIQNLAKSDSLVLLVQNREKLIDSLSADATEFLAKKDWRVWYKCKVSTIKILRKNQLYNRTLDSLSSWINVIALPNKYSANFFYYKGLVNTEKGNTILGILSYKEALVAYLERNDSTKLYKTYKNLGSNYSRLNDHPSARVYYKKSETYLNALNNAKARRRSIQNAMLKSYIDQEEYDLALNYLKKEISTYWADTSLMLKKSFIHCKQNNLAKAEELLKRFGTKSNDIYEYLTMALLYEMKNDLSLAIATRQKILKLLENGFKREYIAELIRISTLHFRNKQYYEADSLLGIALNFFLPGIDSSHKELPNISNANLDIWLVETLKLKGDIYSEEHDIQKAKDYYLLAFRVLLKLKGQFNSNFSKFTYGIFSKDIASKLLEIYFQQFQKTRDEAIFNEAFRVAQNANAFVLRNAIDIRSLFNQLDLEEGLRNKFIELEFSIAQTIDTIDPKKFDEYQLLKRKILRRSNSLENYFTQKSINLTEVQESIPNNSKFIKYFLAEGKCYIFSIDKHEYYFVQIDIPKDYKEWVYSIDQAILNPTTLDSEKNYLEASYRIYKTFLKPVINENDKTDHLIIVPDEALRKISFASLVHSPTDQWINVEQYLVNRYSFSYLYYTSQMIIPNKKEKQSNLSITAFAMEYNANYIQQLEKKLSESFEKEEILLPDFNVVELKNTIPEIANIVSRFGGKYYTNAAVNKTQLKQNLTKKGILHFAGHALINHNNYLYSALLINPKEDKDFFFSNKDILQLDLDNDLIVLSTCESTSGKLLNGEGLMSLGRSFTYSGSNAILGNCWKVQDYSTSIIMNTFYENLKNGYRKDIALQQAQLSYFKNKNLSITTQSPIFWSGWMIYGNYSPIVEPFNTNIFVLIFILLGIIWILITVPFHYSEL